jgi:hypothetical protein
LGQPQAGELAPIAWRAREAIPVPEERSPEAPIANARGIDRLSSHSLAFGHAHAPKSKSRSRHWPARRSGDRIGRRADGASAPRLIPVGRVCALMSEIDTSCFPARGARPHRPLMTVRQAGRTSLRNCMPPTHPDPGRTSACGRTRTIRARGLRGGKGGLSWPRIWNATFRAGRRVGLQRRPRRDVRARLLRLRSDVVMRQDGPANVVALTPVRLAPPS